jgi:hypothetical protein
MARTQFDMLANFLKAHPGTRPVNTHRRGAANTDHKPSPDLDRHRRKCKICRHPNRDEIERDYLQWRTSRDIARSFGITDHTVIFRHAWATGLYERRQRIIAYALHPLLEQSEDIFIKATPNTIISAVQTYSQINNEGRRIRSKPVTNIYITDPKGVDPSRHSPLATRVSGFVCSNPDMKKPNPNIQELEDDSTH